MRSFREERTISEVRRVSRAGLEAPELLQRAARALQRTIPFEHYAAATIERIEGDGSRPAALILYEGLDTFTLNELKPRIHEIFWKHRKLNVSVLIDHFR